MEAKLAEFRARKFDEHRQTKNIGQRLFGLLRRTSSDDSKSGQQDVGSAATVDSDNTEQHSTCSSPASTDNQGEEEEISEPPQKYSWLLWTLKIVLWSILWLIFIELQFGAVFFAVSALMFVYNNTRTARERKKNSLSAYSVFNPNCQRLQGTMTAEQFEAELLYRKPLTE